MTDGQKRSVIEYYNRARDDFERELELMDEASADEKEASKQEDEKKLRKARLRYEKHDSRSSFSSGILSAIDNMLNLLGYEIVINDEDYAVAIEDIEEH